MLIEYKPRGATGYACRLAGDEVLDVSVNLLDGVLSVEAAPEDLPVQAAVNALQRYAGHEFDRRRTRDVEQRRHHEKQAAAWRKVAEEVTSLLEDLTEETASGWCSDCFTRSDHRLVRSNTRFGTRCYVCVQCGSPSGRCDVPRCRTFADRGGGPSESARFCAEHSHEIPSFAKLEQHVGSLSDYLPWLEFEKFNARRFSSIATASVAGVVVIAPLVLVAAPAIGGVIGTYAGLTGAAATSHGLAILGGGSLAAGGFGMFGGTVVVTAAGAGLGGATGASVANAYVRSDKSFGFEKVAEGGDTTVIFANGFLSEGKTRWGQWRRIITERYPDATVYRLTWGAKELKSLAALATSAAAPMTAKRAAAIAALATKSASSMLGPVGVAFGGASLAKNPWHVARTRASMTGAVLADAIVRADLTNVVLVGFSLGGRVMTATAETFATRSGEEPRIQSMHLLGAAVGTKRNWHAVLPALDGTIHNYFSKNDKILSALYRVAERGAKAIGAEGIPSTSRKVKNVDVSKVVNAHQDHLRVVSLR